MTFLEPNRARTIVQTHWAGTWRGLGATEHQTGERIAEALLTEVFFSLDENQSSVAPIQKKHLLIY